MEQPPSTLGLRHVALYVSQLESCVEFYTQVLGYEIEWQPDPDNVYLRSHGDNLALHRSPREIDPEQQQRLDHFGIMLKTSDDVDTWYDYLVSKEVEIVAAPKTHRDGARSFYIKDPSGNVLQMIYHPSISD